MYRCPGETYDISRAVHLARLASFYPACRHCPHRTDHGLLSPRQRRALERWPVSPPPGQQSMADRFGGMFPNELSPRQVRDWSAALGMAFRAWNGERSVNVWLAGDGRPELGPLVAAAADGLRWTGCHVLIVPEGTAASLSSRHRGPCDGALLVGNASGCPHAVRLSAWRGTQPIDEHSGHELWRDLAGQERRRPQRHFGRRSMAPADAGYLAALRPYFYALRPLRVVVQCASPALVRQVRQLAAEVGCTFEFPAPAVIRDLATPEKRQAALQRQRARCAAAVAAQSADLGLWIDEDGQRCDVFDEQGRRLAGETVLALLAAQLRSVAPAGRMVVAPDLDTAAIDELRRAGAGVVIAADTASSRLHDEMVRQAALLGGDAAGHFWFGHTPPVCDALHVLAWLLTLLSRGDLPLSELAARGLEAVSAAR